MSGAWQEATKRAVDVGGSLVGLALLSPLMLGTALAIRLTLGPPVLFRQPRAGLGGRPFVLLKFRTMRAPRPGERGPGSDEARLGRLGRLLRASSLDELPSLLNVLRGEMSLVGPRPLLLHYLPRYSPAQARRHEVKPGVTGLAQVRGRNALGWAQRLALDVEYVERRSLALDLHILALTVVKVLRREGVSQPGHATMSEFLGADTPDASTREACP